MAAIQFPFERGATNTVGELRAFQLALQVPQLPDDQLIYSGLSLLRDG
jgi:hypothetical protein